MSAGKGTVVALSGGIGGAKLALGLSLVLDPADLVVVANTGDDFQHLGLSISPDIDTVMYTLAGINNPVTGWGRRDETWRFMQALEQLGGETWFRLGDTDLATNMARTRRLAAGDTLSDITADFCRRLGVRCRVVPMSDHIVRTRVKSDHGWLDFQDYFVRHQCAPVVEGFLFAGVESAAPAPDFLAALRDPALRAVVICPSNPFISIDPILSLRGIRDALQTAAAPVVAVSPIIGGQAVKGPTAKMMRELGLSVTAATAGERYADFIDGYVVDDRDARGLNLPGVAIRAAKALMETLDDRRQLATAVLDLADELSAS
ncbi:MAG: 2-phospho-L-lactate transferase [Xanthobacteraceae bacterium]|nr:2-phospho-L-lactate transferase [Xanthobacteraceae bacterium]